MAAGATGRGYFKETVRWLKLDNGEKPYTDITLLCLLTLHLIHHSEVYCETVSFFYFLFITGKNDVIAAGVCINVIYCVWLLSFPLKSGSGHVQLMYFTLETDEDIRSVMYRQSMTNTSACLIKCPHAPFQISAQCAYVRVCARRRRQHWLGGIDALCLAN